MEGDRFPNEVRFEFGDAMAPEESAGGVSAINFKPFCLRVVLIDKTQVMKQRRCIEELGVELNILSAAGTLSCLTREGVSASYRFRCDRR
jgi:hypothetical protein